jgi:carboxyl-terminal processing protease
MKTWKNISIALLCLALSQPLLSQVDPAHSNPDSPEPGPAQLTLDDLRTFADVFNQVRRNYVEEVDDKTLLSAAIDGMLSRLDPHSDYLPAQQYKQLDESANGHYIGIGVNVGISDRKIVIRRVIVPSPADSAGINPGDIVTAIDNRPVKGRHLQTAIDEIQGDPGTTVSLSILTPEGETREVEVVRDYVKVPTVSLRLLDKGYAYFRIAMFNRNSALHLRESLESIQQDGISLRGLIIDLRDNPGGVLQQAVTMADGFLEEGLIVSTRGRNAVMQMEFSASEGEWLPGIPVIILVDRSTASASEVFAGALQDHDRAVIVGERTFGKGSVQSVLPLRNGDGIKLTTARYYTPSGRSIQAQGILPDIIVEAVETDEIHDQAPREADLDRHLANEMEMANPLPETSQSAVDEYQLREALLILQDEDILSGPFKTQDGAQFPMEE